MAFLNKCFNVLLLKFVLIHLGASIRQGAPWSYVPFGLKYPYWPMDGYVVSNSSSVQEGYIIQPVDHFDPLNYDLWSQRYFWNDEFYEYEGPIFIILGSKSPITEIWMEQGAVMELCQEMYGIAFLLEHRFYGESWPIANTELDSLSYLTIEQILADSADFINFIRKKFYLKENKVIVVGASYTAALAVYMREQYPHLVDMVWASSAALNKVVNFDDYFNKIGDIIKKISPVCYDTVKTGFDDLEKLIWLGCNKTITRRHRNDYSFYYEVPTPVACQLIEEKFDLCDHLDLNNEDDIRNFFQYLSQGFAYIVQFNNNRGNFSMQNMCKNIFQNATSTKTPIEKLSQFINAFNTLIGFKCIDFTQKKFCEQHKLFGINEVVTNGKWVAPRQSLWLFCSQIGCLESSDNPNHPFGHSFPIQFLVQQCRCAFGHRFTEKFIQDQLAKHLLTYGGTEKTKHISRVIFVNGKNDPWNPLSVLYPHQTSCANTVILVEGGSHIYDLGPTSFTDSSNVALARDLIAMQIQKWISEPELSCCANEYD